MSDRENKWASKIETGRKRERENDRVSERKREKNR